MRMQDVFGDNLTFRKRFDARPIGKGSGMRYMPEKIRDKATFAIFFQNFPKENSTSNWTCKSDDMFSKTKKGKQYTSLPWGIKRGIKRLPPLL
ncbi:hypothetical protein DVH24_030925 [Malus domestica]|uniref:Uncharacterized protein n=1 Tax=Malus domestica TaxID=3750 RepID=A0A498HFE3_MALDO|nr:hypothetical protein DVH24_030925 [Malus domestica]